MADTPYTPTPGWSGPPGSDPAQEAAELRKAIEELSGSVRKLADEHAGGNVDAFLNAVRPDPAGLEELTRRFDKLLAGRDSLKLIDQKTLKPFEIKNPGDLAEFERRGNAIPGEGKAARDESRQTQLLSDISAGVRDMARQAFEREGQFATLLERVQAADRDRREKDNPGTYGVRNPEPRPGETATGIADTYGAQPPIDPPKPTHDARGRPNLAGAEQPDHLKGKSRESYYGFADAFGPVTNRAANTAAGQMGMEFVGRTGAAVEGAAAGAGLAGVAGAATAAVVGLVELARMGKELAYAQEENARRLAQFSPQIQAQVAALDANRMVRQIEQGSATSGTSGALLQALDRYERSLGPIEVLITNIKNTLATEAIQLLTRLLGVVTDAVAKFNESAFGKPQQPDELFGDYLGRLSREQAEKERQAKERLDAARRA